MNDVDPSALTLSFHGGAGTVTGSRHLLMAAGKRVLVDCGMFQGLKELRLRNWQAPGFEPRSLDALLLTHAHMDHAGYIPRVVREGFARTIFTTPPTVELAEVLLLDAAKLQEEDAAHANRHGFSKHAPAMPLYTAHDVRQAMRRFEPLDYGTWKVLGHGLRARLHEAGHVLGSAFVELEVARGAGIVRIVFSGDVGRYAQPLHRDPDPLPACDVLVVESTYGDRLHDPTPLLEEVRRPFAETLRAGGTILIPSFALARTQMVTLMLGEFMAAGDVPQVPVHVDSPMAVEITRIYEKYAGRGDLDPGVGDGGPDPLLPPNVRFHRTVDESKALNRMSGPRIIISSSGMLTGGRVLHHLERLAPDPKNLIVLVGYQAAGTRGRALLSGARTLRMHGRDVAIAARVLSVASLSAHADAGELMRWLRTASVPPKIAFVTHGEPEASAALAKRLGAELSVTSVTPSIGNAFDLAEMLAL
ncbi:MAG TPA: MBL fold metallo-hydrolase [Dehalococcoidia bacterium]|nr:MBL fold metallo-hydrolase [Dehalococcoidia bacterium]